MWPDLGSEFVVGMAVGGLLVAGVVLLGWFMNRR